MKITEINRENLRTINAEIQRALAEVENKFGVQIGLGNSRFSDENYTTKLKVAVVQNGQVKTRKVTDYEFYAKQRGVSNGAEVGDRVVHPIQDKGFIVEGWNRNAKKYPIILSNRDGKFKMSVRQFNMYEVADY